jgi:hypothetical protein
MAETLPRRRGSGQIAAFGAERGGHAASQRAAPHVHAAACKGRACRS